jgi:hypothetical protein
MQSKKQSLIETSTNTMLGLVGSWLITYLCLQFFTTAVAIATSTTLLCTAWSLVRGYSVRRFYNSKVKGEVNG